MVGTWFCQVIGKRIELRFPKLTVMRDPLRGLAHGLGVEAAAADAAFLLAAHQAGALQHANMFGETRQRNGKRGGQFADARFALGQSRQHRTADRVGQSAKGRIQSGLGILNHMV